MVDHKKYYLVSICCKHQWYRMDVKELDLVIRDVQPFRVVYKLRGCLDAQICCICVLAMTATTKLITLLLAQLRGVINTQPLYLFGTQLYCYILYI